MKVISFRHDKWFYWRTKKFPAFTLAKDPLEGTNVEPPLLDGTSDFAPRPLIPAGEEKMSTSELVSRKRYIEQSIKGELTSG